MRNIMSRTVVIVCLMLACNGNLLAGESKIQKDWNKAQAEGTVEAYEKFLKRHREGDLAEEAKRRIMDISYAETTKQDTTDAYEGFLRKHPTGPFSVEARERFATLAFEECKKQNTVPSYVAFIDKHKGTRAAEEASARLDSLLDWSGVEQLVHGPLASGQKSIKLQGLSSSYPDLKGLQWFGPIPEISTWLGLRVQDVDENYALVSIMGLYGGTPTFQAKYPKGIITLPSGSTVEIYSHPADPLKFSWGNLEGHFVEGKGWEFGPFSDADVLKWQSGRGIVVLKNGSETTGFSFGVKRQPIG